MGKWYFLYPYESIFHLRYTWFTTSYLAPSPVLLYPLQSKQLSFCFPIMLYEAINLSSCLIHLLALKQSRNIVKTRILIFRILINVNLAPSFTLYLHKVYKMCFYFYVVFISNKNIFHHFLSENIQAFFLSLFHYVLLFSLTSHFPNH